MRDNGAHKRRRVAATGRIPPIWDTRPTRIRMLRSPGYRPLGPLYFVPFQGGGTSEASGECGGPNVPARTDKILQILQTLPFEWNGCTFERHIPAVTKEATAAAAASWHIATLGEPPIPPPPFGRPRLFEWHQGFSRSQSRREKQVFPRRDLAPPWTPDPPPQDRPGFGPGSGKQLAVAAVGATGGGLGPYRPRDSNNPRIPRKNKTPASHMRLPPFLEMANKLPLPTTATHVPGHPPGAAAFRNKNSAAVAPLPSSPRATCGADDSCASPALSKRNEVPGIKSAMNQASGSGGSMTVRLSHDGGVPESDALVTKAKKPPRMNKSSSERSGGNAYNSNNKAFARAPPFRNIPRRTVRRS
ncbi:hypothetical protein HPB49_008515 [Dermacentor silvarum]|uniref:Uncharacterized protein n=1 Tax=Dermacentor silvarum TaxID=543639 RepID=A0ACB8DXV8_DERSI|nr:hypothetical protein HPB49_008515 [Dermacentor silvarum]